MKTVQELCGSYLCKEIDRGILGKQGDEVMRRIFDACWKSEGKFYGEEREVKLLDFLEDKKGGQILILGCCKEIEVHVDQNDWIGRILMRKLPLC
jgi:hypothetical protein